MYAITMTSRHRPLTTLFLDRGTDWRGWVTDKYRAAQFVTKRDAYARAMALDQAGQLPSGAEVSVVPLILQ